MTKQYEHRPELSALRFIPVEEFGPQHLAQLERLAPHAWDGTRVVDWAVRILRGETWVWEVEGTESAIVLTSATQPDNPELFLEGLAGDGIIRRLPDIKADLEIIAREYGCTRIGTATGRDSAFTGLAHQLGFTPIATVYRFELEDAADGQQEQDHTADDSAADE